MKILVSSDTYPEKPDGVARYLSYVLPRLREFFEISVILPKIKEFRSLGLRESFLPTFPFSLYDYRIALPSIYLKSLLLEFDIIFVQDIAPVGLYSIILAKRYNIPVALFCHHDESSMLSSVLRFPFKKRFQGMIDSIVRKIYRRVDLFFVATERFYRKLVRLGIPEEKIIFNPFSVDTNVFKPRKKEDCRRKLGLPLDKEIILYVGRISKEKNVETILKLASKMQDKVFLIVGKGPLFKELKRKYPLENVIFWGYAGEKELPLLYSSSDIFLHLSFHESQSFTTLEAMASGLPVIVPREEGEHTIYIDGKNVLFVDNILNLEEIGEKINLVLSDERMRKKLSRNARETLLKYSWERHVNVLFTEMSNLIEKKLA